MFYEFQYNIKIQFEITNAFLFVVFIYVIKVDLDPGDEMNKVPIKTECVRSLVFVSVLSIIAGTFTFPLKLNNFINNQISIRSCNRNQNDDKCCP